MTSNYRVGRGSQKAPKYLTLVYLPKYSKKDTYLFLCYQTIKTFKLYVLT